MKFSKHQLIATLYHLALYTDIVENSIHFFLLLQWRDNIPMILTDILNHGRAYFRV